nr:CFEM domain-containing protein (integral membrane protein) [Colletotrichum truncatum]KAF6796639.1 CFEM domain-containing protein (integral membrane protein) [Colletotrichum truncatum]
MLHVSKLGILLLACAGLAAAANQMSLADIPPCAISCMTKAFPLTKCPLTDRACLCADSQFNAAVEPCVRSACTIRENLALAKLTWAQCEYPYQDVKPKIYWTTGVVIVIMVTFFVIRMISKAARISKWGHDDTLIVISFILVNMLFMTATIATARSYWGVDMWVVGADGITAFLKLMFVLEMIYILAMAAIKASILFCFLRIFPDRVFRRAVFATQMFNLLVALTWVILCCVQCQPISYAWNGWDGEHQGGCGVQSSSIGLIHVAFQIAIDLVMLVLPITQVYKLQMDFKKKLGVMAMFLVGILPHHCQLFAYSVPDSVP